MWEMRPWEMGIASIRVPVRVRMEICLISAQTQTGEKRLFASQTFQGLPTSAGSPLNLAFLCIVVLVLQVLEQI